MKSSPNSVHGKRNYCAIGNSKTVGAEEGTRTPTPLRVHGPEPCASANSATSARVETSSDHQLAVQEARIFYRRSRRVSNRYSPFAVRLSPQKLSDRRRSA